MERFSFQKFAGAVTVLAAFALISESAGAQQPPEPVDVSPNNGEIYYLINQHSGLQASSPPAAGNGVSQQTRSFTNSAQRWAFARFAANSWEIRSAASGLCLGSDRSQSLVLSGCGGFADNWQLVPAANGYYAIRNSANGRFLNVQGESTSEGAPLVASPANGQQNQSELWLLRPAYFRGIDNALLEKQEALRVSQNTPWWKDNGQAADVLSMFKDHGINMVRLRPSSAPPYVDPSSAGCSGNACYSETEAQDVDLAKRARNLGMSIELSLLFDGGSSRSIPPAWASDNLQELQTDLYTYVKTEIERYRSAGVIPDLVAIGNEVDTGFLGALGSPTGAQFGSFAALQKSGMQAVQDAASDTALGAPIPAPLTCIHITPAWDLTAFFTLVNQNGIPYDAICQSYYPIYHGPLTDAQAAMANPYNKPVEQDVLVNAANNLAKPIFLIETGEHYENGFDANDPWYTPSVANQRQFLLDLQSVVKALPNQLGMGVEYWDAAGVNILAYGGPYYFNGGWPPQSIYIWNGLTLFNNADGSGSSNQNDPSYSELLTGLDAVGNKLDPTLKYKFVTSFGPVLALLPGFGGSTRGLWLLPDSPATSAPEEWIIQSSGDGYFQIRSADSNGQALVLDGSNSNETFAAPPDGAQAQEWDVHSLGKGIFQIVNRASGRPVSLLGYPFSVQITPTL
ncbi:MAG TPA: glycosyl hydrolase 53 family protein [Bryobacteraceae bacterium]|jgi:arabinogalactan endo-1,4-beta-galactosidase|nr:glycosyl hydrolase 53 family protein [Bryobacteraceae bacterium]